MSKIFHNRVVLPAADVKTPRAGRVLDVHAGHWIDRLRRVKNNSDARKITMFHEWSDAKLCLSGAILGLCLDAFLPTIAFPQQATPSTTMKASRDPLVIGFFVSPASSSSPP